jgi:hypothetical protein
MEPSASPPPKKRRRRWLLAAFAVALVSMVSWWYWPRGDARFVGKWTLTSVDGHSVGSSAVEFWSNGSAVYSGSGTKSVPFPWSAKATTITFGVPKEPLWKWHFADWLWSRFRLFASNADAFFWSEMTYDVIEFTRSTMKIRDEKACEYVFRRIPE